MELKSKAYDKIVHLLNKGVKIPNPLTIDVGAEVNVEQISGTAVTIYPGCRIYGEKTVVSAGATLGYEGPVTIENCQVGPKVQLKGGYFSNSVFLGKASMASGAHVREGCILEEEANGAHCVGLKQTILFPWVTMGSLINFCDCLMAGGTSRQNHSEVGSSYIHFNFTPDGDKTTASLIGDVPKGVMLNQPPIFLGGQGGLVGPLRIGYGNVVVAGTILRKDYPADNKMIIGKTHTATVADFVPRSYPNLSRIVENNLLYLANLAALREWYIHVRKPFFDAQEFGHLMHAGLLDKLTIATAERVKRLNAMAENAAVASEGDTRTRSMSAGRKEFHDRIQEVWRLFTDGLSVSAATEHRDAFLPVVFATKQAGATDYVKAIQDLPPSASAKGTLWLETIVTALCMRAAALMPSLNMFRKQAQA